MKRRGFLSISAEAYGSCLIPSAIAQRIHNICIGASKPLILAPEQYSSTLYAVDNYGSYILHLGDPEAEPDYPTLREFIENKEIDPDDDKQLQEYLEEWRSFEDEDPQKVKDAILQLRKDLDEPIDGYERETWLDWDYELYESPMGAAHRYLANLPLNDGREIGGFNLGSLSFIEGDRPGSNLTYVEVDSLSAIASLQHRLNELQTGTRIVTS